MLPLQKASLVDKLSLDKHKQDLKFQSDLSMHILLDRLPDTVCYCDIELFYSRDQIASMMSFMPPLGFMISKVGQKVLMGKITSYLHYVDDYPFKNCLEWGGLKAI